MQEPWPIPSTDDVTESLAVKIAREFEKRLERLVDGISAAVFRGRLHPVDLANRLIRHADLIVEDGPAGPEIPNVFVMTVNRNELDEEVQLHALERELTATLRATASDRGWRTGGPISVELRMVDRAVGDSVAYETTRSRGTLPPWGQLVEADGGRSFEIADNRALIGRSPETDVTLADAEVSRHHAVLFREGETVWVADVGSSNGTTRNGTQVRSKPVPLVPGDVLTFGPATFTFRLL